MARADGEPARRIACYGGAFDPPHLAHVFALTWLLTRDDVESVWLVPTADHVFGKRMAPFAERVAMLEAIVGRLGSDRVRVCEIEAGREGPSRTYDTLEALEAAHPGHAFCWVIGADNLTESHRWHRFDDLVARWPLIVLGRPGHEAALAAAASAPWCLPGPT
ncbi:MAG: nicotinate (nicotinamide) nucleotide adenylyltransferase, partial [Myxococcales bacterium]|nr:nicotinate (nicotinamide) nucleotide adenylyltransferase [Myxococcales bacterium]